jgi:sulfite exporter TauE/SafE
MRKEKTLFIIGIWVAILPFLGFPDTWRKIFFIITGFMLIYLAYLYYQQLKDISSKNENISKTFIDNINSGE